MPYTSRQKATKPTSRKNDDTCRASKYIPNANSVEKVNEHWPPENGVCVWGSLLQRARDMECGGGVGGGYLKKLWSDIITLFHYDLNRKILGHTGSLQDELYEEKWSQTRTE